MRSLTIVFVAVSIGLMTLQSCEEPTPARATITVSLAVQAMHAAAVSLQSSIDGETATLQAVAGSNAVSRELQISPAASVPLKLAVYSASGDTLGGVSTFQALRPDYEYGVSAEVGVVRPTLVFCGTVVAAAPLRSSVHDTLFVVFGGAPKGTVC